MAAEPRRSVLDALLDVAVYAPLGLLLRARDEVPQLAAHGRREAESRTKVARMVGQMAVAQGRRRVNGMLGRASDRAVSPVPPAEPPAPPPPPGRAVPIRDLDAEEGMSPPMSSPAAVPDVVDHAVPDVAPATDVLPTGPGPDDAGRAAPDADALPIPGYDSLSASQVVQRLPGLSAEELEAVRAYEQAGRGRKTVLLRVAQLRAAS
jgi:hypothetical protein